jgi:hypothetical protein
LVGSGTNTTSGTTASFVDYLASLGAKIVGGVAEFKGVSTETGITIFSKTGKPFCLSISDEGLPESVSGECAILSGGSTVPSAEVSTTTPETPAATSTASIIIHIIGDNPATLNKGSSYIDPGATYVNHLGSVVPADVWNNSAIIDASIPGEYTVTYTANGADGTAGATSTRKVIVSDPNFIPPVATTTATTTE